MKTFAAPFAVLALSDAATDSATAQAVAGFGAFNAPPEAGEQVAPTKDYRVIFDLAQGGPDDRPLKSLQRVARLANLLDAGGVRAGRRHDDRHPPSAGRLRRPLQLTGR